MIYSFGNMYVCKYCGKIITYDCCIDDSKSKYPSCDEVLDLECVHAEVLTEIDWERADKDKKHDITLKIKCPACGNENSLKANISTDPCKNLNNNGYKYYFLA